jgi:hypothetical protein
MTLKEGFLGGGWDLLEVQGEALKPLRLNSFICRERMSEGVVEGVVKGCRRLQPLT